MPRREASREWLRDAARGGRRRTGGHQMELLEKREGKTVDAFAICQRNSIM